MAFVEVAGMTMFIKFGFVVERTKTSITPDSMGAHWLLFDIVVEDTINVNNPIEMVSMKD